MKKFHVILIAAAIFCTVAQTAFLFLLPETVPVHYTLAGEIDRYGSRYVYFLFPGFTILMTVFFGLVAKAEAIGEISPGKSGPLSRHWS